jgi:hypothetical protein
MNDEAAVRIHKRIDEVLTRCNTIDGHLQQLAGACGPCQEKVGSLGNAINGNPGGGLKSEVAVLNESVDQLKKNNAGVNRWFRRQMAVMIGAVASFLAMAAAWLFR